MRSCRVIFSADTDVNNRVTKSVLNSILVDIPFKTKIYNMNKHDKNSLHLVMEEYRPMYLLSGTFYSYCLIILPVTETLFLNYLKYYV